MKEIKLTIDGKEVRLTKEQLRMLGIEKKEIKKHKSPFGRLKNGSSYYYVGDDVMRSATDTYSKLDNQRYVVANYFSDSDLAYRVCIHHFLYRKLLKFAYDNGYEDTAEWDGNQPHYYIVYDVKNFKYYDDCVFCTKMFNTVYFSCAIGAERAIKEVVEPFIEEFRRCFV